MLRGIWIEEKQDLSLLYAMREKIWGSPMEDEMDEWSRHLIIDEDGIPVAVGTITENLHHRFTFSYLGVVAEKQKMKIGDFLIRIMITDAWEKGAVLLDLMADENTRSFFMKEGFFEESRDEKGQIYMKRKL